MPALTQQLKKSGYANAACLAPRALPLHASLPRLAQVAPGFTLPARVVGPHGEITPGNEEIYADAYHRVRVQYFWQKGQTADDRNSAWVPVMQRTAGPTRGASFLPRIGQEVLVGFINGQLDQPVVLVSLYNGRGEGSGFSREDRAGANATGAASTGAASTDTGTTDPAASPDIFAQAHDSQPAGQGNRAAGQSPALPRNPDFHPGGRNEAGPDAGIARQLLSLVDGLLGLPQIHPGFPALLAHNSPCTARS